MFVAAGVWQQQLSSAAGIVQAGSRREDGGAGVKEPDCRGSAEEQDGALNRRPLVAGAVEGQVRCRGLCCSGSWTACQVADLYQGTK